MTTRELERTDWQSYFDRVSRAMTATRVDLEISGPDMGAQPEAHQVTLTGLSYDPRDDAFSIVSEELEHRVSHPAKISVREEADKLKAVEIVDGEDHRHIAMLSDMLQLPGS